ncbi:cupin domain-containing protein [Phenylobacterium sp.]|uniref:cupin domain-containing protein n=1 Tax=Phenylobacterium sp. TaxID=1871053 RepID=UPI0012286DE7|nr:cupin domain-containing protein [Phenylobacterium sp.]THD57627.1 MAG: hypothetical protein E8A49_22605 [Phenylobacterium sp.]
MVGEAAAPEFLKTCFGRDAFRRRLPAGEASRLFNWDLLNRALAEHRLGPPRFKLEKGGVEVGRAVFRERRPRPNQTLHDLDVAGLYEQLRDGATLILDAVNEFNPPLQQLCAGLAAEFCAFSQANLYACWGESQGFDVHWDDHDVFVVQVDGAKRWDLYGLTRPAPLRREREAAAKPTNAPEEIVLEACDMLYLPRGYWHAAVGLGEPSLHLTIGLSRKTGADLLHWLADQAVAEADVRADLSLEADDAALGDQVAGVLRGLLASGDPAELGRRYRRHLEATARHRPTLSLPHIGRPLDAIRPDDRLALTAGAASLEPGAEPSSVCFSHRGVRFTLAAETAPALSALMTGAALTYADLVQRCGEVPERRVQAFVQEMLRRGVFAIEPAR